MTEATSTHAYCMNLSTNEDEDSSSDFVPGLGSLFCSVDVSEQSLCHLVTPRYLNDFTGKNFSPS